MLKKGFLPITVITFISSVLYTILVNRIYNDATLVAFTASIALFFSVYSSVYDIIHKLDKKANQYRLCGSIIGLISFSAYFLSLRNSNIFSDLIFIIGFIIYVILLNISARYEENN